MKAIIRFRNNCKHVYGDRSVYQRYRTEENHLRIQLLYAGNKNILDSVGVKTN